MPVETQSVDPGEDFNGTPDRGLWEWHDLDRIPRTTRVSVVCASLATLDSQEEGRPPLERASWFFRRRAGGPNDRILLDRADASAMVDPLTGVADRTICGRIVPRDQDGEHWDLVLETREGMSNMSAHVDWLIQPFPDTSDRDPGPEPTGGP